LAGTFDFQKSLSRRILFPFGCGEFRSATWVRLKKSYNLIEMDKVRTSGPFKVEGPMNIGLLLMALLSELN